ncbi:hypothetical protein [Thiomicrorhabdus lithotrophica]|uniref:Uncharacterized protein n=1 Tax=Thiomicrorhabdus lithotrophica TaxID=2949997 RepID=A0ABY8CBC8_9GAMM|nr:hypothetical protein [Thiomicrorhabdus lithotrophica]WEJ63244.1 hypothetical protein NR989_03045 [Thiomicrorhabdus lithotrophica]
MDAIDQTNNTAENDIPSPEEMLSRLQSIDVQTFNMNEIANELKGNQIWVSILTIPVSASVLVGFTLLGSFMFDRPIVSFLLAAGLLFWISKMFENQERHYKIAARHEVIRRIAEIEGEFGLIPHFKSFLPNKYRHLWQSLRKGQYHYIEQYVQAVLLLQNKLEPEQFKRIWYLTYPETDPEYVPSLDNQER